MPRTAKQQEYRRRWRQALREETFRAYGGFQCGHCDYSLDSRALQLDHINGGGCADRRKHGLGHNFYIRLRKLGFPPGYQVLCANCNTIKKYENNEFRKGL